MTTKFTFARLLLAIALYGVLVSAVAFTTPFPTLDANGNKASWCK